MERYINLDDILIHKRTMHGYGFSQEDEYYAIAVIVEDINSLYKRYASKCKNGHFVYKGMNYCPLCGDKLNWKKFKEWSL